jgi:hypothetical protein
MDGKILGSQGTPGVNNTAQGGTGGGEGFGRPFGSQGQQVAIFL